MKFYKLDEAPVERGDRVFKASPVGNAIATAVFFGIAAVSIAAAQEGWKPHGAHTPIAPGALYFVAGATGLFGLLPLGLFRASLRPTNWLLRCGGGGLAIKYRAYENWRLPASAEQVMTLDYPEIAWARLVKEKRISPSADGRGTQIAFLTYINVGLTNPDTAELEKHLSAERNLRPNGRAVFLDYPVQVQPGGVIEVRWSGIRPKAREALAWLSQQGVRIEEPQKRCTDLRHHRNAGQAEDNAKIITLMHSGDEIAAVKVAQQSYGYSLTRAKEFVEELVKKGE